jgi:hypothetical protein
MTGISVVHLVWAPLGPEPLRAFLSAVAEHPAGTDHELLMVFNGFADAAARAEHLALLDGIEHERLDLPAPTQDLPAYHAALQAVTTDRVCFLNSYARPLADGWLATLDAAVCAPGTGLAGASGSWESAFSSAPLALRLPRLRSFPPFPNPHLRTNGFLGARELLNDLDWGRVETKLGALELESGRRSLTRQVARRGLRTVVVGRDGASYDPGDWAASATFRAGGQANLLIADNRTDDYLAADGAERLRLGRMAWRRAAQGD